jgi:hypothetical protein
MEDQMSARILFRWAGVSLIVTAVSLALGLILHPMPPFSASIATSQWAISHLLWWIGALAGIVGLAGLYLRQREDVGILGFIGSSLGVIGLALVASAMYFEAFIAPSVAARAPELFESFPAAGGWEGFLAGVLASGALFGVGFLLFGITMFRAHTMPRWAIVLAVLGGIPFAVNFLLPRPIAILAVTAHSIGLAGLGYALWKSVGQPVNLPATPNESLS